MRSDDGHGNLTARAGGGPLAWSLLAVALLSSVGGCAAVSPLPGISGVNIEGVPLFPQDEYQCGPASLAAVMNYWKVPAVPDEISREIFSKAARGTLTIDMMLYAERKGLKALQYRGGWDDLRKKIAAGYPLVVLVDGGFSLYQANHYMVVTGFGDGAVIVNSGSAVQEAMEIGTFLSRWERAGFWTLWIYPGQR